MYPFLDVLVSFDSSDMMVKEGEGDVVLRLKSSNPYTVPFTVFVRCFEVHPVQAKQGTIVSVHILCMCTCVCVCVCVCVCACTRTCSVYMIF